MRADYDILVVGGGPAGCEAARAAAADGARVLVVEKDPDIGVPVRCAEGISVRALREFYEPNPVFCRQTVTEYHLVAPNGVRVEVTGIGEGVILDRKVFDRMVAEDAARAGAQIITNANATGAHRDKDGVVVSFEGMPDVKAKILIGADGTESRAGRWLGLKTACRPHDMETAAQYVLAGVPIVPTRFEMHFGTQIAPGGYLWVFPKGEGVANVGLGISGQHSKHTTALEYLDRSVARLYPNAAIVGRILGGISCSGGLKQIVDDNVMLVGDAAHQANPLTGGGIATGLKAGRIAGRIAAHAIRTGDCSKSRLMPYHEEWDDRLGNLHRRFYRIKEAVFNIPDETLNDLAEVVNKVPKEGRTMNKILARVLAKKPGVLLDLARIMF
jgi:digeranylgeranylglycerophospholipid reductase